MKKILCIDGGGIRGILSSAVIAQLEDILGTNIAQHFDLIAGTSTGGIISIALTKQDDSGAVYSAREITDFYIEFGRSVFSKRLFGGAFYPKYKSEPLEQAMEQYLGHDIFYKLSTKVMITTYDLESRRPYFFKNWKERDYMCPVYKIATATSSAPIFFPPTKINDMVLIDGAIAANNPAMCAYAEAKKLWPNEELLIVSIGTGDSRRPIHYDQSKNWGVFGWLDKLVPILSDAPTGVVDYQMRTINRDAYIRLQPQLIKSSRSIDDASQKNITALLTDAKIYCQENSELLKDTCRKITQKTH